MAIPEYRVRVFLSVDLSGSTAYKAKHDNPNWIKTFTSFYSDFDSLFQSRYVAYCEARKECTEFAGDLPKLWKTVGDEIIFVNRINCLQHLFCYIHAFQSTLFEYRRSLATIDEKLNLRANGWVASFPRPNQTIPMAWDKAAYSEDSLPTEQLEEAADKAPHQFEFLGPGIDSGFRIAKNSLPEFFTMSPALAFLACKANVNHETRDFAFDFKFKGVDSHKGVIDGRDYPIVGLYTESDENIRKLNQAKDELCGVQKVDVGRLFAYLEIFLTTNKIDIPSLPMKANDIAAHVPPEFYATDYVNYWNSLREADETRKAINDAPHSDEGELVDVDLPDPIQFFEEKLNSGDA